MMSCVFNGMELPCDCYAPDVREIMSDTIERFGKEEWHKVVLTNEIHGHLGIYSTLGAKMGCYAMSLHEGDDEPKVLSYAGSQPPVSCFNDGLQVSTGATMGHGLFFLSGEDEKRIEARFTWKDETMLLRLRSEYAQTIQNDIRHGVEAYGHSPRYWSYVRQLALKYWSQWNRDEIFEKAE